MRQAKSSKLNSLKSNRTALNTRTMCVLCDVG